MAQAIGPSDGSAMAFDFEVDRPTSVNHRIYEANDRGVGFGGQITSARSLIYAVARYVVGEAGVHGFRPVWMVSGGTGTLCNAASSNDDSPILFSIENKGPVTA
jgi:hypothetical protein